ncbi:MAG: hypothetical protein WBM49_09135 [Muriicola sp.]
MKFCTYIMAFILILGCVNAPTIVSEISVVPIQTPLTAKAGDSISLRFKVSGEGEPFLILENSLGTSVIPGIREKDELLFTLPTQFTQKSGFCTWNLVHNNKLVDSGKINISSLQHPGQMETYLGPRSIYAGSTDYTMLVNVPTDSYDNPVMDGTPVQIKSQVLSNKESFETTTKDLISWKRLYPVEKSGRMLVTANAGGSSTKELSVDIFPSQATGFDLYSRRNHEYADGNQIIIFETSVIKDMYGNTISDGTLVTFQITNAHGSKLKTNGTTINGIATARMLHPEVAENWKIEAYVTGFAKSDAILINFKPAIQNYDLSISENDRTILVGPILSFLDQLNPDGIAVEIKIADDKNKEFVVKRNMSVNGFTEFTLSREEFIAGEYMIEVTVAGITKKQILQLHE